MRYYPTDRGIPARRDWASDTNDALGGRASDGASRSKSSPLGGSRALWSGDRINDRLTRFAYCHYWPAPMEDGRDQGRASPLE